MATAENIPAMQYQWDGDALTPLHPRRADQHLVVGEVYLMEPQHERSQASHNHEFAWLKEAWMSLPENLADQYPTTEHLRKRALIAAGFYDETIIDAGSRAAALRVSAAVQSFETFALVFVRDCFVIRRVAKSQSRRAMGKADFERSKEALLAIVSELIGVKPDEAKSARAAA